jgi:hypothetical protein
MTDSPPAPRGFAPMRSSHPIYSACNDLHTSRRWLQESRIGQLAKCWIESYAGWSIWKGGTIMGKRGQKTLSWTAPGNWWSNFTQRTCKRYTSMPLSRH